MNVLIIEDRREDRELVRRMVTLVRPCEFIEASSVAEALATAGCREADLVLLDWTIPDCQGLHAISALRDGGVDAPIVVITARADDRSILEAFSVGVANYLTKPLSMDVIRLRLGRFLCAGGA